MSRLTSIHAAAAALAALLGSSAPATADDAGAAIRLEPAFEELSSKAGLSFQHFNGMVGAFYFPEMTGQGGGLIDYDGDGDLDVLFRQGTLLARGESLDQALFPIQGPLGDRLFRNDLIEVDGLTTAHFVDVTRTSGLRDTGYGMGLAVGDYDADGHVDLYLTNYGPNQLWRNRGDGTFEEVTTTTGTGDSRWSTSATFVDIDDDSDLDLFAANYVQFDVNENPRCFATTSARDYCGPSAFTSESDRLWRNRGDGSFEDITSESGIGRSRGAGLGVISGDFDGDGRIDLYVANDGEANHLWLNRGNGTFSDDALFAGAALNRHGSAEASMGLAAADFDGDGNEDLFLTHLAEESNTFYRNLGDGLFEDRSRETSLAAPSMPYTSFGVVPLDFDNDGWPDLAIANGAVRIQLDLAAAGDPYPLEQPNQLFRNLGDGTFAEVTAEAGAAFSESEVSRGLSAGDLDHDGATDLVVFNNNGPARLLANRAARGRHWLGVAGTRGGDRIRVVTASGRDIQRVARTDGSYCSTNDMRVIVGMDSDTPVRLEIATRSARMRLEDPPADVFLVLAD